MQFYLKLSENYSKGSEIADELGFCTAAQFGTFFRKHAGLTPTAYRKGEEAKNPEDIPHPYPDFKYLCILKS